MEVPTDVREVLQRQRRQLMQLFAEYCDGPPNVPLKKRVIREEQVCLRERPFNDSACVRAVSQIGAEVWNLPRTHGSSGDSAAISRDEQT